MIKSTLDYYQFYLSYLFIFLTCSFGYTQTGPGGIGSNDGTSNLVLWLDANTASGTSGSLIRTWQDRSGYGHDFNSGVGAIFQPASQNGYATFNFNGSNHYFQRAFTTELTTATFSFFSATNVTSSNRYKTVISHRDDPPGTPTAGFMLYSRPSTNTWEFWNGRNTSAWQVLSTGVSTSGNWAGQTLNYSNATLGKSIYINSTLTASGTAVMTLNPNRPIRIGAGRNEDIAPDYYFEGNMGEIVMFNTVVNDAQRIILENYLSAKYSYTLAANEVYVQDNPTNGNFDHNVAGIGRLNAANLHNDAQGTGIIRFLNPRNLGNNEFFLWGNNNGALTLTNTTDVPSADTSARFNRVWRVSETNTTGGAVNVGNLDLRIDTTGMPEFSANYPPQLIVDTDGDGLFNDETSISGAVALGANIYQFTNVSNLSNSSRFTFGIGFRKVITNRKITYRVDSN